MTNWNKSDMLIFVMVELETMITKLQKNDTYFDIEPLKEVLQQYEREFDRLNQESLKKS